MEKSVIDEFKTLINVISLLEIKEKAFREDLDYFFENGHAHHDWPGPLKRLEHEIMFLCIDTYSLHQGISKKKSFYSKIIKQYGNQVVKTDKSATVASEELIHLGILGDSGMEEASADYLNYFIEAANKRAVSSRETLRKAVGVKSNQHSDMDEWMSKVADEEQIKKLSAYRKEFAHRLDSLEKLKKEFGVHHPHRMKEMLDVINSILSSYKVCFRDILAYTSSISYSGATGLRYDSILRIKQWHEMHS